MKSRQRLMILGGILVVIAVFLSYGLISSTIKFFGGTKNNNVYYEEEIMLGDTGCAELEYKYAYDNGVSAGSVQASCSALPGECNGTNTPTNPTNSGTYIKCTNSGVVSGTSGICNWTKVKYTATEQGSECKKCSANYYKNGSGCTQCPAAFPLSSSGSNSNTDCYKRVGAGKYVPFTSGIEATCKAGTYIGAHLVHYGDTEQCNTCSGNTYSRDGAASCTACSTLSDNYYCNGHVVDTCPEGKTPNSTKTGCDTVTSITAPCCVTYGNIKGTISNQATCNQYLNEGNTVVSGECTKSNCTSSQYLDDKSCKQCSELPPGYYCNNKEKTACSGTVSGDKKSCNTGVTCPTGYPLLKNGGTSTSDCYKEVAAGEYVAFASGVTASCPNGMYSIEHYAYYGRTDSCTSCSSLEGNLYCDGHIRKTCNANIGPDRMSCTNGFQIATFTCNDKEFNGKSQPLATCTGCSLSNAEQTAPKEYTITATLEDGYRWNSSGEDGTKTCKAKITCPTGQKANAAGTGCESAITLNCGTGYVGERITCSVSGGMINGSSSSNNPSVAKVEGSGSSFITVLGIKAGTATITTTVNGSTVSGTVTIKDASKPITKISINGPSSIEIGTSAESRQYTAVVTPTDHDDKIQWSSSDTSIATIGASGVLYAVAGGEVTITARAVVGNISATKKVKITVNSNCSVTATNVSGFKHMSINETEQASFTINGKSCGTQIDIKRSYFKGASTTLSGETESFTPTSTCVTGSIKGCIKGTTVCSNSITIELRPTWSGPKVLAAVAKSTYENAPKSASAANVAGKDYYYDEGCPLNSKKGVYENCNYYYRGCGGGGGSSAVPHCYVNGDDYKWEYTAPSGYTLVENVTKEENCRKEEEPACYKDSSGEYHWGKYATTDGYEVVPSIKNENACKKPSETEETYACYKKDNDYTWTSSQPEGYELVPDKNTPESCAPAEEPACYLYNGEFTWGPYKNRNGYILLENITSEDKCKSTSNACYKDKNGNYVWGDYENNNDYEIVPGITSLEDCAPETPVPITDINVSKLVYAFMAILMAFGIGFIYYASVLKKNN